MQQGIGSCDFGCPAGDHWQDCPVQARDIILAAASSDEVREAAWTLYHLYMRADGA